MVSNRGGHSMPQGNFYPSRDIWRPTEQKPIFEAPPDRSFTASSNLPNCPLPIDVALRDFAHIPVTEFIIAARLENGEEKTYTSQSLRPFRAKIFTEQFRKNFSHYSRRALNDKQPYSANSAYAQEGIYNEFDLDRQGDSSSSEVNRFQYRSRLSKSEESTEGTTGNKRKRSHFSNNDIPATVPLQKFEPLVIGNSEKVEQYYVVRFKDMQQSACKVMGKAFVKLVEPKKQTHHPYTKGDEKAPPWWPPTTGENGVRHKEPDHLYKPERIRLLCHILRMIVEPPATQCPTVQKLCLTVKKLEEVTMEAMSNWFNDKDHPENASKRQLLREVFTVAKAEERFRNGEIDADTEIQIMFGERAQGEDSDGDDDNNLKEEDDRDAILPTHQSNTPELVSPPMMSNHSSQFEEPRSLIQQRPHPTMIRTSTNPQQHLEDNYAAEQNYHRSMSFQQPHSPNIQDPYRRTYIPAPSPGFHGPPQTMYPTTWPTNFITTSSPSAAVPPATSFQLPAPQPPPQNMIVPRMHQHLPFEPVNQHQRYDAGPALGSQIRTGSLNHTHQQQMQQNPNYHEFMPDGGGNPYQGHHEAELKVE